MRNKILMTLALLLTAVTGAWAGEAKVYTEAVAFNSLKAGDVLTDGFSITKNIGDYIKVKGYKKDSGTAETKEYSDLLNDCTYPGGVVITVSGYGISGNYTPYADGKDANAWIVSKKEVNGSLTALYLDGYNYLPTDPNALTVEWDPATKTGNFTMPAYDVEIAPIYAPVAQWAKVEDVDQLPTAIEGIYAGTEDAIVNAGTVVEGQGTAMYFATTDAEMTAEKAAQANGWLATVPTAAGYDDAQTVYVWYYIQGADTPEGEKATAENTFNDSEICTEPITVTLLSNKFNIQFNAANDNTIEAGKATVKVGETAAEVDAKGNLTGVKMNSKVTVTAKPGYKFRKVEVKKGIAPPDPVTVTWNSPIFNSNPYTRDGVTLTTTNNAATGNVFYNYGNNTFTTTLGKFIKIEIVCTGSDDMNGWTKEKIGEYHPDEDNPEWVVEIFKLTWTGNAESVTIPGKSVYEISSITFTIQ